MSNQSLSSSGVHVFGLRSAVTRILRGSHSLLKRVDRALAAVVLLSVLINLIGVNWGLPFPEPTWWDEEDRTSNFPWAFDAIAPVGPLAAARDFFSWGRWSQANYVYPLFHYVLLGLLYAPAIVYWFLSGQVTVPDGPGYPYGLADPENQLALLTVIARLTSAAMASSIVVFMYLIGKKLYGRRVGLIAALMTGLCYTLVFYAHTSNLEVPSLFWGVAALYVYLKIVDGEPKTGSYLGFGILAAIAMGTKDQAYGLFILPIVHIAYTHYRRYVPEGFSLMGLFRSIGDRRVVYAIAGFVMAYAVTNNLFFNLPRLRLHFRLLFGGPNAWPCPDRYLPNDSLIGHYLLLKLTAYHTIYSLGLPMALVCAAGLIYCLCRWPQRTLLVSLPALSFYVFFVDGGLFYVHPRYTLPLALTLTLFGAKLLADMSQSPGLIKVAGYLLTGVVLVYSLASSVSLDLTLINDSRRLATVWVQEHVPPGASIEVYTSSRRLPYLSRDYKVRFYRGELGERLPTVDADYLIVTERSYRQNSDTTERVAFERALQRDGALRKLLNGTAGYTLQAEFHYRVHDLLFTDVLFTLNPRVLIFKKDAP
jgi:hypothetical protein